MKQVTELDPLIVFVDGSRCRSGGAIHYIQEVFFENPTQYPIKYILYVPKSVKKFLPANSHIIVRCLWVNSLLYEVIWQFQILPRILKKEFSPVLFTLDSASFCEYDKQIVLNQDILSFSPFASIQYSLKSFCKLWLIKIIAQRRMSLSICSIFLTEYARNLFQKNLNSDSYIIPHGCNKKFFDISQSELPPSPNPIYLTYVSPITPYKNHIHVVKAVKILRQLGYNIHINLVGGFPTNRNLIQSFIDIPYINLVGKALPLDIIDIVSKSHILIFASSCESFGITLLEKMASSIPLCTSIETGLSEIIGVNYPYSFIPTDSNSIVISLKSIIDDYPKALYNGKINRKKASLYNWNDIASQYHSLIYSKAIHYRP